VRVSFANWEEILVPSDVLRLGLHYSDLGPEPSVDAPIVACSVSVSGETVAEWP
jgi:hypothetical protein